MKITVDDLESQMFKESAKQREEGDLRKKNMAGNCGMEKMVCSIINPYRIDDPMTYRILD